MFSDLFAFDLPAIVNFVGGGGKTGLILTLLREYAPNLPVLYTTTTRIHPPHPTDGLMNMVCEDIAFLTSVLCGVGRRRLPRPGSLVLTSRQLRPDLHKGLPPTFSRGLDPRDFPVILNEADGARSMSLKMPREGEPVLMEGARYLVPVIGVDVLGRPLGPSTLFRWEMAAERFPLPAGEPITPGLAAQLLLHADGVCKGWCAGMQVIPFVNKVDTPDIDNRALALCHALLTAGAFPIERVVWGSLRTPRAGCVKIQND